MPTVRANGLDIGYDVHGAGPPLILLHGATSIGSEDFAAQIPLLSRAFRVHVPDARGHGRTRWDIANGFRYDHPQDHIDCLARRELADAADAAAAAGPCTIEAYTVIHSREGIAEKSLVSCLLADGRRAWGTSTDPALTQAMCAGEWVGTKARLDSAGTIEPS